jgi:electron transfer flavoprotein beta subunit
MHIVVLLKQVHEPNTPTAYLSIGADGKSLAFQSGTLMVLNAYDANAVEEAVRVKEKCGASVTAMTVGDKSAITHIRRALAMGADRGVHVEGPTGIECDPATIAALLVAAIGKLGKVDLILCGRQASDTDAGQVPFELAEMLGFTPVSPVVAVSAVTAEALEVMRLAESGTQHLRVLLPAVVCVSNEINKPRPPGLKGVMAAKKADVPTWSPAELGCAAMSPALECSRLELAPRNTIEAEMITAGSGAAAGRALAERLHQEGYV